MSYFDSNIILLKSGGLLWVKYWTSFVVLMLNNWNQLPYLRLFIWEILEKDKSIRLEGYPQFNVKIRAVIVTQSPDPVHWLVRTLPLIHRSRSQGNGPSLRHSVTLVRHLSYLGHTETLRYNPGLCHIRLVPVSDLSPMNF